jgi:branched-subunit amino acid transport protein
VIGDWAVFALLLACGLGTYLWRGLGVWIGGKINTDSPVFAWVSCVAYAMLAGLIARMIFFPVGVLTQSQLWQRMLAVGVGFVVFKATRNNMLLGIVVGAGAFPFLRLLA